jgi:hypothetical protein
VSSRLPGDPRCPACDASVNGYTDIEGTATPTTGDISLCLYCRSLGVFVVGPDRVTVREPEAQELEEFLRDPGVQRAIGVVATTHRLFGAPG